MSPITYTTTPETSSIDSIKIPTNDTVKISIYDVLQDNGPLAEYQGQKIYDLIITAWQEGKRVILSFAGLAPLTWSFITKSVAQIYVNFPDEQIKSGLELIDISADDLEFIDEVTVTKREYLKNPEKFKSPKFMSQEEMEELCRKYPDNPWFKLAVTFKHDDSFEEFMAIIAENRRREDEEYFRQLDAEGVTE